MKANEAFPSNFLKESDLNDEELVVTIKDTGEEEIGGEKKLVLYFKEVKKGLIVNKTNFKAISKATGEEDSDDWDGKKIILYPTETEFKGDTVPCIRVKSKPPKAAKEKDKKAPKGDGEGDDFLDKDGTEKF